MSELDKLREWLKEDGFRIGSNDFRSQFNECGWYAYRRSKLDAPSCECNDEKPSVQIVVLPSSMLLHGQRHEGVEVEICGQAGCWWKLRAYALRVEELREKLPEIEAGLIAAWRALPRGAE